MKITSAKARVYEWSGSTVPARPKLCVNAMDLLQNVEKSGDADSMASFKFFGWTVVEVETDEGVVGLGNIALAPRISMEIVNQYLAPLLLGEDPFDYEYLWQKMYRSTLAWGRKGVGMAAISGVDIALWDIMGKATGKPVFKLLGGRTKKKIRCYASKLYNDSPENMQAEAQRYVEEGFTAFKLRAGHGPNDGPMGMRKNIDAIAAVREVIGYDTDLMVDCYMGWTLEYAKRMLPKLEKFELRWLEEPVIPDDIDGYVELNHLTSIPVSGGEHEFTNYGFLQLLEKRAVSVIQYDTNRVGGITAARKVNALAETYGVPVIPHAGQMHNYHLTMSTLASPMSEYFPVFDVEVGNELFYYLFEGDPQPEDGFIDLSDDKPGLGISLSREHSHNFRVVE